MKIIFALVFVLTPSFFYSQALSQQEQDSIANKYFKELEQSNKNSINKPFPNFSFKENNDLLNNTSFKGKVVFINFWFEACSPCIAELDALNDLYIKFHANNKFDFISFTFETEQKAKELKEKYQIQYRVIPISREECYRLNNNNGFPTNIVVDTNGLIKYRITGGNTDKDKAKKFITDNIYPKISSLL